MISILNWITTFLEFISVYLPLILILSVICIIIIVINLMYKRLKKSKVMKTILYPQPTSATSQVPPMKLQQIQYGMGSYGYYNRPYNYRFKWIPPVFRGFARRYFGRFMGRGRRRRSGRWRR